MEIVTLAGVTDANLTTNATEDTPVWSGSTSYSPGQLVAYQKRIYSAIKAGSGRNPATELEYWLDMDPTNPWAMFDSQIDTQTVRADDITVAIAANRRFDTLTLFNVSASSVTVTATKGGDEVYNATFSMVDYAGIANYWDHFFRPVRRKTTLLVNDLPILSGLTLGVQAVASGDVKIGHLAFGLSEKIGHTQYGATLGYLNFSKIELDAYGRRKIAKRTYKKQGDFDVWIEKPYVSWVHDKVIQYRDEPALIIASNEYSSMVYFGLIIGAKITVAYPLHSVMRVQIEDL